MRYIKKPEDNQREVYNTCISNIRDKEYKERLEIYIDDIVEGAYNYDKIFETQIHSMSGIYPTFSDDMKKLYNQKFARKKAPARKYYDKLIASAPRGLCPLCGQRLASTIDHYLPKSIYPLYSVTIVNLIPVCMDCNKNKGDYAIQKKIDAIIHPYFDVNIDEYIWLNCKIKVKDEALDFIYDVVKPDIWDDILYMRVKNHFDILKLNALYKTHSVAEFENIRWALKNILKNEDSDGLKRYIEDYIESYSKSANNSWQVSMYKAILIDINIFCDFIKNMT